MAVVVFAQEGIDRDGHGADADRAEKGHGKGRSVAEHYQDALLTRDAEATERVPHPADTPVQIVVGHPIVAAVDRDLPPAAGLQIGVEDGADVVVLRNREHRWR